MHLFPPPLSTPAHKRSYGDELGEISLRLRRGSENGGKKEIRTTEEKKELLGTLLGNVDALVAGVRQQGIWGLG